MIQRFTPLLAGTALVLGTFAVAQAQPKMASGKPAQSKMPMTGAVTATGIVVGAPRANDFNFRTAAGIYRVQFQSKANMKNIRGGDRVRIYGRPLGRVFQNANVRLLEAKASDIAADYSRPSVERLDGKPREGSQEKTVNID